MKCMLSNLPGLSAKKVFIAKGGTFKCDKANLIDGPLERKDVDAIKPPGNVGAEGCHAHWIA
ncbi:MAG: hypothetical protein LBI39_00715 [Puniceicoccales bacterium]|nr:hypothetical protein [Puniceicoccales bacterium]